MTIMVRSGGSVAADITEEDELQRLRRENDAMRKLIAESEMNCMYCGLPKAEMAKCRLGFPGCGRADDLLS